MSTRWRQRRIDVGWGRMSAQVAGDGPPVLLLHGLGGSGRYWAALAPHLARDRTLVAPDLAGFGRSDKPDADYSREFHLDSLERLLDELGIGGPLAVAGHSMGGVVAGLLAARRPDRIESLAIVASPFPRPQTRPYGPPQGGSQLLLYRTVQHLLPYISPFIRRPAIPRAVVADYLRHTLHSYRRTAEALVWDVAAVPELEGLRGLTAPQLLLYSETDSTIARDSLDSWRRVLPGAAVRLTGGGHQLLLHGGFAELARWLRPGTAEQVA
jgi:pimeloyl-ACP methyl ester carboxylesterase